MSADMPSQSDQRDAGAEAGPCTQGPVVTFNVLKPDGSYFGYRQVACGIFLLISWLMHDHLRLDRY